MVLIYYNSTDHFKVHRFFTMCLKMRHESGSVDGMDYQWPFQEPKLEVPIRYIRPIFQAYVREYPQEIWPYMVQYLHFRILEFPLNVCPMFLYLMVTTTVYICLLFAEGVPLSNPLIV